MLDIVLLLPAVPLAVLVSIPIVFANWLVFRHPAHILFRQKRVGRDGKTFCIYKFRTLNVWQENAFYSWKSGQDVTQATGLGRFLRASHLDELPQVLNIARGDMSFIGPRPETVEIHEWASHHVSDFSRRLIVRPGLTGYAQITQGYTAGDVDAYKEKVARDLVWLRSRTFIGDLRVLLCTVGWVLRRRGGTSSVAVAHETKRLQQPMRRDDMLESTGAASETG